MRNFLEGLIFCGLAILATSCSHEEVVYDCGICESEVVAQSFVHKYGMEVPGEVWSDRGKNGKVVSTLRTGVVVTANYDDGYLEGETTYTFPHSGALEKSEIYAAGQLVKEREMYPSGHPKKEVEYNSENGKIITLWYDNGTPHFREEYDDDKLMQGDYYTLNSQVESKVDEGNGIRINRDEFGQMISKDKIEQGLLAMRTVYYPNGTSKEIIPYYMGKIHGQRKTFLPGGEPKTLEGWTENKQEGITIVFHNGEKMAQVPYFNGLKNGVEERYKDERYIVEEINWKNGRKHGPSTVYVGDSSHITWYYEGQEVSKRQYERLTNPTPK